MQIKLTLKTPKIMPFDERDGLMHALQSTEPEHPKVTIREAELRDTSWDTFVIIVTIVSGINEIRTLANTIIEMCKNVRSMGRQPQGVFERDNSKIDLATATDEELLAWFLNIAQE